MTDEPMYLISESELTDLDGTSDDELVFNAVRARGPVHSGAQQQTKIIRELRNALFVAANRYHDLRRRCECNTPNELQFRSLVESALSESEVYKPEYETGDPLDWRRRHES